MDKEKKEILISMKLDGDHPSPPPPPEWLVNQYQAELDRLKPYQQKEYLIELNDFLIYRSSHRANFCLTVTKTEKESLIAWVWARLWKLQPIESVPELDAIRGAEKKTLYLMLLVRSGYIRVNPMDSQRQLAIVLSEKYSINFKKCQEAILRFNDMFEKLDKRVLTLEKFYAPLTKEFLDKAMQLATDHTREKLISLINNKL